MDIRIKKTKRSIINAFLELRTYRPLEKITVKDLCEKAEINKSTFYKHYSDIFDLSSQLEAETIEQILANLPHPEYVLERPKDFMIEMYSACLSQSAMIDRLFSGSQNGKLVEKLNDTIREWIFKLYPQYQSNTVINIYLTYAIFGGYHAIFEGMKSDSSQAIDVVGQIVEKGAEILLNSAPHHERTINRDKPHIISFHWTPYELYTDIG